MEINMTGFFSKKGMKSILSMALSAAVVFGFVSCNNGEDLDLINGGETKTVVLKLEGSVPSSYTVGNPVTTGADVVLSSGYLYFVDGSGKIVDRYHLTGTETNLESKVIALGSGATISGVPVDAVAAHFAGNPVSALNSITIGGNISAVEGVSFSAVSQKDITKLNLYGKADLSLVASGDGRTYSCTINPKTTVARIELSQIAIDNTEIPAPTAAADPNGFTPYDRFTVYGVFVDNYFATGTVAGGVTGSPVDNGTNSATFADNTTAYPTSAAGAIYDWKATPGWESASKRVVPEAGKVWGYNLPVAAAGSVVPRIIFKIGIDKTTDGTGTYEDGFITVQGLKSAGVPLTSVMPGNVYRISSVNFKAGIELVWSGDPGDPDEEPVDPPTDPEPSTIDAVVTIAPATWSFQSVDPIVGGA